MKLHAISIGVFVGVFVSAFAFAQSGNTKTKRPASKLKKVSKQSAERAAQTEEKIWKILNSGEKKINLCTSKYLRVNSKETGKLEVSFVIESDGSVKKVTVSSKLRRRAYLHQCMLRTVRSWEFPRLDSKQVKMSFGVEVKKDNLFKFRRPPPKAKQSKNRRNK